MYCTPGVFTCCWLYNIPYWVASNSGWWYDHILLLCSNCRWCLWWWLNFLVLYQDYQDSSWLVSSVQHSGKILFLIMMINHTIQDAIYMRWGADAIYTSNMCAMLQHPRKWAHETQTVYTSMNPWSSVEGRLYPPMFRIKWSKRSFRYRGYMIWDSLPEGIQKSDSLPNLKQHLLYENYFVWLALIKIGRDIYFPYIHWYVGSIKCLYLCTRT